MDNRERGSHTRDGLQHMKPRAREQQEQKDEKEQDRWR